MHLLGDFVQRWPTMKFGFHELDGWHQPGKLGIGLEIGGTQSAPVGDARLHAEEDKRPVSQRWITAVSHYAEEPEIAIGIRQGNAIAGAELAVEMLEALTCDL